MIAIDYFETSWSSGVGLDKAGVHDLRVEFAVFVYRDNLSYAVSGLGDVTPWIEDLTLLQGTCEDDS